jgi:hypothetical protein
VQGINLAAFGKLPKIGLLLSHTYGASMAGPYKQHKFEARFPQKADFR